MNTLETNRNLIINFVDSIWNKNLFNELDQFIHPNFVDHSLPPNLSPDKEGLKLWITGTGMAFEHRSVIENQVTEGNNSIIKFRMFLKHIGPWRDILPTGAEISTIGYRSFRIENGKIIEHWALLDGNSIENQLRESVRGCKIQE
jgi:predicted SnoaL-like aldol condensation-catalyzing enzyme